MNGGAAAAGMYADAGELQQALDRVGYLADEELATTTWLALSLRRPLFLEGEPGVGKTALADAIAGAAGIPLFRIQCHEGLDASQTLYDWDFRKQLLFVRAVEQSAQESSAELYDRRFLLPRAVLSAIESSPSVLLIDEVDRADDEFEAFLLEALGSFSVTVPEIGVIRAGVPPIVVVTSNRTRDVHDALKRRCFYHWLDHPRPEIELEVLRRRVPGLSLAFATDVVDAVQAMRGLGLIKAPGLAECLDWGAALDALHVERLDASAVRTTLGALLKHHEDLGRVRLENLAELVRSRSAPASVVRPRA